MLAALVAVCLGAPATAAPVPDLRRILSDPQWVARSPHQSGWSDDGRTVWYRQERPDSALWDWWTVSASGGAPTRVLPGSRAAALPPGGHRSPDGRHRVVVSEGDVWVADRRGRARAVTATDGPERQPRFLTDGRVAWRLADAWFSARPDGSEPAGLVVLRPSDDPREAEPDGFLESQQLRLFQTLTDAQQAKRAQVDDAQAHAKADPTRPRTVYVGKGRDVRLSSLSPSGDWLLVAHTADAPGGRTDPMPRFVTTSGYVETVDLRPKVGTRASTDVTLWLVPVAGGAVVPIDLDDLPGRSDDPLADLRPSPDPTPRDLFVEHHAWSPSGDQLAVQLWSIDQKDRWTLVVPMPSAAGPARAPEVAEHLHDPAWVNDRFGRLGWLDDTTLWFQSEASGWSHLYTWSDGSLRALTDGPWEVHSPRSTRDGRWLYFKANRRSPAHFEVHRVSREGGPPEALTALGGMNDFWLSPDERNLLVKHSEMLAPPELYVQPARPRATARRLTHTIEAEWAAIDWVVPTIEALPSTHHDRPIWARVYRPTGPIPATGRPAVVFAHGAGDLQNAHAGWSGYFREAMFHSLLVRKGYVVVDVDYRASAGYGRDWRAAIHRQMGHPELEDLSDVATWLVGHEGVHPERVGIYGGSYGGFLALMALFRQPDVWGAGAALRPVTDWANYNDGYTRAILHTPEEDPEAYTRSSPIEYAEGLADPLLICHGMVDTNVPFQDSVRLAQRLIELEKTDWELAGYPMEGHGFRTPEAWLDEYRRVLALFDDHIGPDAPPWTSRNSDAAQ